MTGTRFPDTYYRVLIPIAAVFIFLILNAIGTIYIPYLFLAISLLFAFFVLIFTKPLIGVSISFLICLLNESVFLFLFKRESLLRIPILILIVIVPIYIILIPKIVQNIRSVNRGVIKVYILILFLFGYAFISILWSHYIKINATYGTLYLGSIILPQLLLAFIKDKETLIKMLWIFLFIGVLLGILLIISLDNPVNLVKRIAHDTELGFFIIQLSNRPGGFIAPNMASMIMNAFIFIGISLLFRSGLIKRILLGLLIFFFAICTLLTASKVGAFTLLLGVLFLILFEPSIRLWRIRLSTAILIACSLILLIFGETIINRFKLLFARGVGTSTDPTSRLMFWRIGFEKFLDTFGIGTGSGGTVAYFPVPSSHSFFLSVLFDLGVIGFLILIVIIGFLINTIRKGIKNRMDKEMSFVLYCFLASLITVGTHATVEADYYKIFYWAWIGIVLTVLNVLSKKDTNRACPGGS